VWSSIVIFFSSIILIPSQLLCFSSLFHEIGFGGMQLSQWHKTVS
jgi:hypothetical protein